MQELQKRNRGDRLRRERSSQGEAGRVLRGSDCKREKRACKQKQCEEQGVENRCLLPVRIIDKSLVSDQIIIDTIVSGNTLITVLSTARARFCCATPAWASGGRRCAAG